ncbi:hypothetical protein XH94_36820 [Bradyrhizobium zhanjiangense]|uniref:Uncharacterized protein n=1 Tax=Bradyrhizobium zhanjiangense TaxID=1325107 RepID=A0A4Q0RWH2_9BRAD|nr:hypothetical protein XH94_36820 [Bradyrhizobium zhanjiangense]
MVAWHPQAGLRGGGRHYFTEEWFRIVILFDYLVERAAEAAGRIDDTHSAILFHRCNAEMKEKLWAAAARSLAPFLRARRASLALRGLG